MVISVGNRVWKAKSQETQLWPLTFWTAKQNFTTKCRGGLGRWSLRSWYNFLYRVVSFPVPCCIISYTTSMPMVARQLNLLPWWGNKRCALLLSRPLVFHTHGIIRDLTQKRLNAMNIEVTTHITYNNSITSWTRTWERWKTFLSRQAFQFFSSVILLWRQEFWQCEPGLLFNLRIWHHWKLQRYTTAARQCITPQIWP